MSSNASEQRKDDESEGHESSKKRPYPSSEGDEDHDESVSKSMENRNKRFASDVEGHGFPSAMQQPLLGLGDVAAANMEPAAPLHASFPPSTVMADQSNMGTPPANLGHIAASPTVAENQQQQMPMGNPIFMGSLSIGAQMASMGMQANPALFQQHFMLANRSYPPQINMQNAVSPQLLTQQQSLTAQQALTAASSVSTQQGRDASSITTHESGLDLKGQHGTVTILPPQPQHQMLQPPQQQQQQQALPMPGQMPVGALPPGQPNPLHLQFLQRGPLPAPMSDADAAAFCNRMLLTGFPLAGGMAVPALFAQQMNRQRVEGPVLVVPTPRMDGICLALTCDDEQLSEYQILVRKQLEIFEAQQEDVESNTQGRKKQVVLGQVGIRCKHCSGLPLRQRGRGAVYYPAKLQGVYQAAQNMASSHLCESCQYIPHGVKQDLRLLRERRDTASGGKQYWADGARAMGLYESEEGLKLRRPTDNPAGT